MPFNNTGVVNVQTGTLNLAGGDGGSTTGDFNVSAGATLQISSDFNFSASSDLTGAGSVNFSNGTQQINGTFTVPAVTISGGVSTNFNVPVSLSTLDLTGGTLAGSSTVTVSGSINWVNGNMAGSGVTNANGGIVFGNTTLNLNQRTLNLAAGQTAAMSGANTRIQFLNGAIFNNSGTFFAQNDQDFVFGSGGGTFNNIGTFTRDTSAGTFTVGSGVFFNNTGVVNVQTGTLNLAGGDGGSTTGDFNVSAGATLQISSDFNFAASSDLTGAGSVNFSNGTQQINGTFTVPAVTISGGVSTNFNVPVSLSTLDLTGGTLAGSGTVTVSGPINWVNGTMAASGVTNANGGMVFGNTTLNLNQRTLNLAAGQTAAMSGANTRIQFLNGAIFNNSGTFFAQNDQDFVFGSGGGTFNNIGTFTRDTSAGTFTVGSGVALQQHRHDQRAEWDARAQFYNDFIGTDQRERRNAESWRNVYSDRGLHQSLRRYALHRRKRRGAPDHRHFRHDQRQLGWRAFGCKRSQLQRNQWHSCHSADRWRLTHFYGAISYFQRRWNQRRQL